jgi:hypothetical protein
VSKIESPAKQLRVGRLHRAAAEFFYLQNFRYPRASALRWVGNRLNLNKTERDLLHRGVFSQEASLRRRAKKCSGSDWLQEMLVVDGHNVQITIESAILGRTLLVGNDGALRDLAGQSARFRFSEVSELALDMVFSFFAAFRPGRVLILFDAPLSHSGYIADQYRKRLARLGLTGEAKAVAVPEREFPYRESIIASSDQAVLDASAHWLDLARWVIDTSLSWQPAIDFSHLIPVNPSARKCPELSPNWHD